MKLTRTLRIALPILGISLIFAIYFVNIKITDDARTHEDIPVVNEIQTENTDLSIDEPQGNNPAHILDEQPAKDTTQTINKTYMLSKIVHQKIIEDYCDQDDGRQLTVMKDAEGNIGAYIVSLPITDTPVTYIDPEGKQITSFYIFATPEENETPLKIIANLQKKFPNNSIFICPDKLIS